MELYSVLLIFFGIGGLGIYTINSKDFDSDKRKSRWIKYFVYVFLVFGQMFLIQMQWYFYFGVAVILGGIVELFIVKKSNLILVAGLIPYLISGLFYLIFFREIEVKYQQFLLILVVTLDGYSQICGELFGKTKTFPAISPNKTLEGLLGGLAITMLTALFLSRILEIEWTLALLFSTGISVFAIAGDLLASYYKRINGRKDFSRIIPGHGGILDRFDSLILAGSGFYLLHQIDFANAAILNFTVYLLLFLSLFGIAEMVYFYFKPKVEYTRKFVHFTSGIICLTFPFYIENQWIVLSLCAGFMLILYVSSKYKFLISINGIERKSYGSLTFPVSVYLSFLSFQYFGDNHLYFYLPILILAICDPLAALIGKKWPYGKFAIGTEYKTIVGSVAFFGSCLIIQLVSFQLFKHSFLEEMPIWSCCLIAAAATLTEAFSKNGLDNITIPLSVLCCLVILR